VPNGADVAGVPIPIPLPLPDFPGPTFGDVGRAIAGFFGFGGGSGPTQAPVPAGFVPSGEFAGTIDVRTGLPPTEQVLFGAEHGNIFLQRALGRAPIPTPAQGGPPLVTERFQALPGPFVPQPDIPILQELGIPFPEPLFPFQPRPIPEPDVLEEEMAVDSPLLAGFGSLVPAVRSVATPTVSGFLGGLAQDVLSGFLRAPQELGAAQVPMRPPGGQMMAAEKPSTRILRQIRASTGVRVKLASAKALIRQLGLQNGARCLGISVTDACTLIITSSPSGLVSRRRAAPRRRARHVHAIQHTAPGG